MPKKLTGLSVREVSGVDAAANKRTFLVAKSASTHKTKGDTMPKPNMLVKALKTLPANLQKALPDDIKALLASMDSDEPKDELVDYVDDQESDETLDDLVMALGEALDDVLDAEDGEDKREAVEALLEQFMEMLGGEGLLKSMGVLKVTKAGRKISQGNMSIIQQIQALLGQLMANAGADPSTDPNADPGDGSDDSTDVATEDDVQMARKAKKDAFKAKRNEKRKEKEKKPMAKSAEFIALEKRQAATESDLKKERDIRLNAEFLQKARDIGPVPGTTFEKSAALLKSLSETNPTMAAQVEEQMKASSALARKSAVFSEFGKNSQGGTGDSTSQFIAKANDIAKRDSIGIADAFVKAAKEEPELYAQYAKKGA